MKKYFSTLLWIFFIQRVQAEDESLTSEYLKQVLIWDNIWIIAGEDASQSILDRIFAFIRDGIFELLFVFALCIFLYIAFRLIIARGNPEEFKKALTSFIYAAIGLFIIAFAWALVRLVAGLSI